MKILKNIFITIKNAIKKITNHYYNKSNDSLNSTSTESNVIQPSFHKGYVEIKEDPKKNCCTL